MTTIYLSGDGKIQPSFSKAPTVIVDYLKKIGSNYIPPSFIDNKIKNNNNITTDTCYDDDNVIQKKNAFVPSSPPYRIQGFDISNSQQEYLEVDKRNSIDNLEGVSTTIGYSSIIDGNNCNMFEIDNDLHPGKAKDIYGYKKIYERESIEGKKVEYFKVPSKYNTMLRKLLIDNDYTQYIDVQINDPDPCKMLGKIIADNICTDPHAWKWNQKIVYSTHYKKDCVRIPNYCECYSNYCDKPTLLPETPSDEIKNYCEKCQIYYLSCTCKPFELHPCRYCVQMAKDERSKLIREENKYSINDDEDSEDDEPSVPLKSEGCMCDICNHMRMEKNKNKNCFPTDKTIDTYFYYVDPNHGVYENLSSSTEYNNNFDKNHFLYRPQKHLFHQDFNTLGITKNPRNPSPPTAIRNNIKPLSKEIPSMSIPPLLTSFENEQKQIQLLSNIEKEQEQDSQITMNFRKRMIEKLKPRLKSILIRFKNKVYFINKTQLFKFLLSLYILKIVYKKTKVYQKLNLLFAEKVSPYIRRLSLS